MERTLEFQIEIDKDGNFKVVSYEPESGIHYPVIAGNANDHDEQKFNQKVGIEVLSWIEAWCEELEEDEE